ncbi:MAG: ferritin, partial [Rhodothermales bacterium]|nr:ferritin [Rhodothermales bacterium]
MKKSVQDALNAQIDKELYAAHLYLAMAAYFEHENLPGFAHWMRLQNEEEVAHAMRIFDFVNDNGGRVTLGAIDKPPTEFKGALEVMKQALKHEQKVTKAINDLYELAMREKAHATALMLQWFIGEQVEEERQVTDIIARMELGGDSAP